MVSSTYCIKHCGTTLARIELAFPQELQSEKPRKKGRQLRGASSFHCVPKAIPKG